ncbi:MAG: hypothetical protein IJW29_04755 [Clostridia bacterium]|nr:hypothetical protein [Clostridia bacterium]
MKKFIFSMAGAASLLASASILIDYGTRKASGKDAHPVELTAGIASAVAGAALTALGEIELPKLKRKKKSEEELVILLNEEDLALLEENADQDLTVDEEAPAEEPAPTIELDEEATIEDFIEK